MWALRLGIVCALFACEDTFEDPHAPIVESVRPATARSGVVVTLVGKNFGLEGPRDRVWLGGVEVEVETWADRSLAVRIPADNGPGVFDFVVRTDARVSQPFAFEVAPGVGVVAP